MRTGHVERLMAKVSPEPNTGCWLWAGFVDGAGYGQVRFNGATTSAHRAFWLLLGGSPAEDIDHRCRVRCCVNPAHMEPTTHRENTRRSTSPMGLNARKTHCKRGHEFTPANTIPHGNGNRNCRACGIMRRAGVAS